MRKAKGKGKTRRRSAAFGSAARFRRRAPTPPSAALTQDRHSQDVGMERTESCCRKGKVRSMSAVQRPPAAPRGKASREAFSAAEQRADDLRVRRHHVHSVVARSPRAAPHPQGLNVRRSPREDASVAWDARQGWRSAHGEVMGRSTAARDGRDVSGIAQVWHHWKARLLLRPMVLRDLRETKHTLHSSRRQAGRQGDGNVCGCLVADQCGPRSAVGLLAKDRLVTLTRCTAITIDDDVDAARVGGEEGRAGRVRRRCRRCERRRGEQGEEEEQHGRCCWRRGARQDAGDDDGKVE